MREIRTVVEVHASIEDVWRVAADLRSYEEWNPFIPGFEAEPKAGARGRMVAAIPGQRPRPTRVTLLEADPPRRLSWRGHLLMPWLFGGTHYLELAPSEAGTRVVNREEFRGVLARLMLRVLGGALRRGYVSMNEALKRRVEAVPRRDA